MSHNAFTINGAEPSSSGVFSVTGPASFIRFGRGEANDYVNSGATATTAGSAFFFYDSAPLNTISGATLGSGWVSSFSLPAGKFMVSYQTHVVFSATGQCGIGLYNSLDVLVATPLQIGSSQASNGTAFLDIAVPDTFSFKITQASNVSAVGAQGNTPSEYGHIFVLKVQ